MTRDPDLVEKLSAADTDFTIFAPIDKAFHALGFTFLYETMTDDFQRNDLLSYHVFKGTKYFHELGCTQLLTMSNGLNTRTVCDHNDNKAQKGRNNPREDMPNIIRYDIEACNAVIHVVDQVLFSRHVHPPVPEVPPAPDNTLACLAQAFSEVSDFHVLGYLLSAIVNAKSMVGALPDDFTLFAPNDGAFGRLLLIAGPNLTPFIQETALITDVLSFHLVLEQELLADELKMSCTNQVEMANGKNSRTVCDHQTDKVYQKGEDNDRAKMPEIVGMDWEVCGGIVHFVNQVMLPPNTV